MIGEDPQGIPNNLMPYVAQVLPSRSCRFAVLCVAEAEQIMCLFLCTGGSGAPGIPECVWK